MVHMYSRCAFSYVDRSFVLFGCALAFLGFIGTAHAFPGETALVVKSPSSQTVAGDSENSDISADGRYVVIGSAAANMVANDTNFRNDFFVFDRTTTARTRIDLQPAVAHWDSGYLWSEAVCDGQGWIYRGIGRMQISGDGRYVAAELNYDNTGYGYAEIVLYDRTLGTKRCVASVEDDIYFQEMDFSSDTSTVAYVRWDWGSETERVWLVDTQSGTQSVVPSGLNGAYPDGYSRQVSLSADGKIVAFTSSATNLVPENTWLVDDVFVYDRTTGTVERVSRSSAGAQGNQDSYRPSVSADGRWIAYASSASNLVSGDTNGKPDIFVYDRQSRVTTRVSLTATGAQSNGQSGIPSISQDGRYITFWSAANNLVAGDTNGRDDIFVRDRIAGTTIRVSVNNSAVQGNSGSNSPKISADGRFVAYRSAASNLVTGDTNRFSDVFLFDRQARTVALASRASTPVAGMSAYRGKLSADGNLVVFDSPASNLVSGDTNSATDVFVRDRAAGTMQRVDVSSAGQPASSGAAGGVISRNGRFVIFDSSSNNLVSGLTGYANRVFLRDRQASTTVLASVATSGAVGNSSSHAVAATDSGRYVLFNSDASNLMPDDTNGEIDVFVRDFVAGTTTRVNVSSTGGQAVGDYRPTTTGAGISADGRYVLFTSAASNLVPGDTIYTSDVFIRDRTAGTTSLVSIAWGGVKEEYMDSWGASMTPDARYVAFISTVDNLVPNDTNGRADVFVCDRVGEATYRVSVFAAGQEPSIYGIAETSISADGRYVTFSTSVFDENEQGEKPGIAYVHDRQTGVTKPITVSSTGVAANAGTWWAEISADGRFALFSSTATNLVSTPITGETLYLHELAGSGTVAYSVSPTSVGFGNATVGTTSAAKTVTVSNTGTAVLSITSITLSGTNPGQFSQTNNCPAQVSVGGKCTVSVKFRPTSKGSKTATLKVTPGGGATTKNVSLAGTGI